MKLIYDELVEELGDPFKGRRPVVLTPAQRRREAKKVRKIATEVADHEAERYRQGEHFA